MYRYRGKVLMNTSTLDVGLNTPSFILSIPSYKWIRAFQSIQPYLKFSILYQQTYRERPINTTTGRTSTGRRLGNIVS